jgi:hypothetical protein
MAKYLLKVGLVVDDLIGPAGLGYVKIQDLPNLAYQAPWAHSQALVALGHTGLGIAPSGA